VTVTQTATLDSVPSSVNCVVKFLGQCDGDGFTGCGNCADGLVCTPYTRKLFLADLPETEVASTVN
jgi:Fungal cellulose binding domain